MRTLKLVFFSVFCLALVMVGIQSSHMNVAAQTTAIFSDVPATYWAAPFIEAMYNNRVTTGCATNPLKYCPESPVTRAQLAVFLLRTKYGSTYTPPVATGTVFTDVSATYWAAPWIEEIKKEGITGGCGQTTFCPESPVTRAQMAVFLIKAVKGVTYTAPIATGTVFTDVPTTYWAAPWIEVLYKEGITSGCGGGKYCPDASVTRAQIAVFLANAFHVVVPTTGVVTGTLTSTPTALPTLVLSPSLTMPPTAVCSLKGQGDANCDGVVNGTDYDIWKSSIQTIPAIEAQPECPNGCQADFDKDGKVTVSDYEIWRNTLYQ